jgi:hypothetical protein
MPQVPPATASAILVSRNLQKVARQLDEIFAAIAPGEKIAWSLFVWTPEIANYVANARRDECIRAIEALLAKWKQGMPDVPAHERR